MPEEHFQLVTEFEPAGDQPTAIAGLLEGLEDGLAYQTLLGVTGSGKTFTVANIIATTNRPALILAPNKTLAAQLYGEMLEFFPENCVEYFVSYYDYYQPEAYVPSSDTFIEKDSSINEHIEQMRLSATRQIFERRDTIIVATVSAIYGLGDPESYHKMVIHLKRGDKLDQRGLLRRLAELQYSRNDVEFFRGMYRVRGEVIDIFPAEGEKEAAVREAEGRKEAAFLDAEAREREAEAEARATAMVSTAIAKGDVNAVNYFVAQDYVKAFGELAKSPNQKTIIVPAELSSLAATVGGISGLLDAGKKKTSK